MHYQNKIKRFILRKNFWRRVKMKGKRILRKLNKNEFNDIHYLFKIATTEPKIILDCGANIGFVTHQFLNHFPSAKVYAFEPNPEIFKKLENHYQQNNRVKCYGYGIAEKEGTLIFNVNNNSGTSSFLNPNTYHLNNLASKNSKEIAVPIISIGKFLENENIKHIDLLKLDIEGYEIKALEGIKNLNEKVSVIYLEVNLIPTYHEQPLIEDVIYYLRKQDFYVYNFYGINENKHRQASITNLVFYSKSFKEKLMQNGHKTSFNF